MKAKYVIPEMEIIEFDNSDIVTASGFGGGEGTPSQGDDIGSTTSEVNLTSEGTNEF